MQDRTEFELARHRDMSPGPVESRDLSMCRGRSIESLARPRKPRSATSASPKSGASTPRVRSGSGRSRDKRRAVRHGFRPTALSTAVMCADHEPHKGACQRRHDGDRQDHAGEFDCRERHRGRLPEHSEAGVKGENDRAAVASPAAPALARRAPRIALLRCWRPCGGGFDGAVGKWRQLRETIAAAAGVPVSGPSAGHH